MVSEYLYGDNQASDIIIEDGLFSDRDFDGPYEKGNKWNILDKYFECWEVEDFFIMSGKICLKKNMEKTGKNCHEK